MCVVVDEFSKSVGLTGRHGYRWCLYTHGRTRMVSEESISRLLLGKHILWYTDGPKHICWITALSSKLPVQQYYTRMQWRMQKRTSFLWGRSLQIICYWGKSSFMVLMWWPASIIVMTSIHKELFFPAWRLHCYGEDAGLDTCFFLPVRT